MNIRARLAALEEAKNPPPNANPLHGLAKRMREHAARRAGGIPLSIGTPTPGSLAVRMRGRGPLHPGESK
jgi:hypothetical protein